MANAYPRETVEFQPVSVTRDGTVVTAGISFAVVPDGTRPVDFTDAVIQEGKTGVMVSGLASGTYRIFARLTAGIEVPVVDCGYFYIE